MVPDVFHEKVKTAVDHKYSFNLTTRRRTLIPRDWLPPKDPVFREEFEVQPGRADFNLRPRKLQMENPHNLSVFQVKPKYIAEREKADNEKADALQKLLEAGKPHDWIKYHDLEHKKTPIAQQFPDVHNRLSGSVKLKSQFLEKDKWAPAYLELARTMKDDFVYGKPKLDLYYKGVKSEAKNTEFGGVPGRHFVLS